MTEKYIPKTKPCGAKLSARLEREFNEDFGETSEDTGYSQGSKHYYRELGQWFQEIRVKNPEYKNDFQIYCVIPSDSRENMKHFFIKLRPDTPKKKWIPAVHNVMKQLGAKNNLRFLNLELVDIPEEKLKQPLFILEDGGEVKRQK